MKPTYLAWLTPLALTPLALIAMALGAQADTVVLTDGTRVDGTVISATSMMVILRDTSGDLHDFARSDIAQILRQSLAPQAPRPYQAAPQPNQVAPDPYQAPPAASRRNRLAPDPYQASPAASQPTAADRLSQPTGAPAPSAQAQQAAASAAPWSLSHEVAAGEAVAFYDGVMTPTTYVRYKALFGPYLGAYVGGGYGLSLTKRGGSYTNAAGDEMASTVSINVVDVPVGVVARFMGAFLGGGGSLIYPLKGYRSDGTLLKMQFQPQVTAGYEYRFPFGLGLGLDARYGFPLSHAPQWYGGGLSASWAF